MKDQNAYSNAGAVTVRWKTADGRMVEATSLIAVNGVTTAVLPDGSQVPLAGGTS